MALARALRELDLPAPVRVDRVGTAHWHAVYRLHFQSARLDTAILRLTLVVLGWDSRWNEWAALELLGDTSGLKVATEIHLLPPDALGSPATLSEDLPGHSAAELLARDDRHAARVARMLGEVRSALDRLSFGRPALRAAGPSGFLPMRPTWREEWWVFHHQWTSAIDRGQTHLGLLSREIHVRARDGLHALDTAAAWTLVHRDLQPGNVLVREEDGGLRLAGVVDWAGSLVGDALVDWVQPMLLPGPWFDHFVEGVGREAAAAVRQPEALARLEVYLYTRCLAWLALAGMPRNYGPGGGTRAKALERARRNAERVLEPQWVLRRIQAALDGDRPVLLAVSPSAREVVTRLVLERFRFVPPPVDLDLVLLAGALALVTNPVSTRRTAAERLLDGVTPILVPATFEPIRDREAWRADLVDRCMTGAGGSSASAGVLWLALSALDVLDHSVSDAVLRGLEGAIEARLYQEARAGAQLPARTLLSGGLIWLAARQSLGPGSWASRAESTAALMLEAWDVVAFDSSIVEVALPEAEAWPPAGWVSRDESTAASPVLLHALHTISAWPLPASRGRVWGVLTREGAA